MTLKYRATGKISTGASANAFYNAIQWTWCRPAFGSWCSVDLTMYDASDVVTTNSANAVKRVYTIQVDKLIPGISASNILIAKTSTTSTVTA